MAQKIRSKSARARSACATSKTVSNADLHEMARSKTSVRDFVAEDSLRAKSEVGVEQATREAKRAGRKQAWAPSMRHSLSSSSARFQNAPSSTLPPHPDTPLRSTSSEAEDDHAKPDDAVHIEHLEKLRAIFDRAAKHGGGKLDADTFMRACSNVFGEEKMNEEELRTVFKKIDNLFNGCISWDDFCTFLYLDFRERDSAEARAKKVDFHVPAKITVNSPHQGSVCAVGHLTDGALITCSEEGTVCFWSQELELKRTKPPTQMGMDQREKPKWISDMALSLPHKKIILATGDCELQFFEMVNFEPYCQLNRLEAIPLKITCWHAPEDEMKTVILVGDKNGTVMVMITENILDAFKHWKLGPKSEGLPSYSLHKLLERNECGVKCYRWKLHSSWVTELHYFPKLSVFASCSTDPSSSLVLGSITPSTDASIMLGRQTSGATTKRGLLPAKRLMSCDQRVFRVAKGVASADYCSRHNVIVTGSVDRLIRVWNPYMTTKPVGVMEGHTAPVFFVRADSTNSRVYSVGNDNTIMVWDTVEFICLKTVLPSIHKFLSPTQAAHFNPVSQQVVLAADEVAVVQVVLPLGVRQDMVQSHCGSVSGLAYSACFNHLVTSCTSGVVKVWDLHTGSKVFEFSVGSCEISCMDIDESGKRIVTGSPNGQLKVWSYNSGECLKTLDKGNKREVTRARFVSVNQNKYIVAVGWDKKPTVFPDVADTIQEVYMPLRVWSTTSEYVHKTDILTVAFGSPHFMATSSFCGKIVVWSLISYRILNELKAEYPIPSLSPSTQEGDEAVQDLMFLNQRTTSKLSASLVASGPAGYIHFWNFYNASKPMACFLASNHDCVTSLAVDSKNIILFTGDIEGFLSLWRIETYCRSTRTSVPPKRVAVWRAHTQRITQLLLVEQWNTLISASTDTSVRVWTLEGHFIGTFGQETAWTLGMTATYQHPMKSRDLLISTPTISTPTSLSHAKDIDQPPYMKSAVDSAYRSHTLRKPPALHVEPELTVTEMEEDIEVEDDLLKSYSVCLDVPRDHIEDVTKTGKWLRHYRTQSGSYRTAASHQKAYRLLPYQKLDQDPDLQEH